MNWDNLYSCILLAAFSYILLWLVLIHPINKRYKRALATLLGKEIARSLYQQMHPEFMYATKKYHPSDVLDEIVLKSAMEMFATLCVTAVIAHPNFAFYFEQYNTANNGFQVDQE